MPSQWSWTRYARPANSNPHRGDLDTACGVIEAGTVGAIWARCIGVVGGKEVITIEHVDRMADDLAPDWPKKPVRRHGRDLASHD